MIRRYASASFGRTLTQSLYVARPDQQHHGTGTGPAGGAQIDLGLLGQLVALFNERFGSELADADAGRHV